MTVIIVQGLKIKVGCESQPDQNPVVVAQNSDANLLLSFFDDCGNPIDVTGATTLQMSFLEEDGTTLLTKSLGSGITLVAGKLNQAVVAMLAADFALLAVGDNNAQVKLSLSGINYAMNLYYAVTVQAPAV